MDVIAPCGMNCSLCLAFQRKKDSCPGCNAPDAGKRKYCAVCRIRQCEKRARTELAFCYSCDEFPCTRLKSLDKRYRTKYGMSMIENQEAIRDVGINRFVEMEREKWTCPGCGSLLCVHRERCLECGGRNERFPGR